MSNCKRTLHTLKSLRVYAGMNQLQWAKALGVTLNTVCNWEAGKSKPDMDILHKMSNITNCLMDDIVSGNGRPTYTFKELRLSEGMGLDEWAEALGVPIDTVVNWENGKEEPTASLLQRMGEITGISLYDIILPSDSFEMNGGEKLHEVEQKG